MSLTRPFKAFLSKRKLHSTSSVEYNICQGVSKRNTQLRDVEDFKKFSLPEGNHNHIGLTIQTSTPLSQDDTFQQITTQEEHRFAYDVIMVGNSNVGKSCIKDFYLDREFNTCQPSTLVADFTSAYLEIEGEKVCINLWDTAGHPSFLQFSDAYFKRCCAVILVYAVNDFKSFSVIQNWIDKAKKSSSAKIYILVGNKSDISKEKREVSMEEAKEFAMINDLYYYETSCRTGTNVNEVFTNTFKRLYAISTSNKIDQLATFGIKYVKQ